VRDSRRIDSREPARPARPVSRNSLSLHRHSRALARTTVGDGRYLRTVIVTADIHGDLKAELRLAANKTS